MKQQSAPKDTAAILIEPVLGEGGYVQAPPAFLQGIRKICDEHSILLIVDEVQSGFGRTGKLFNVEYSGVRPDIVTMAKVRLLGRPKHVVVDLADKGPGKRIPIECCSQPEGTHRPTETWLDGANTSCYISLSLILFHRVAHMLVTQSPVRQLWLWSTRLEKRKF